ncbi:unnamed protein product [Pieris macdunnoughi]|uniref:Endonuclease-reverse transcriptase n=1 Tax=Pieris macdunnoughi TaxID=345717 RepID=A0A821N1T0_9NEOP|nr:unnamed protein product [Pieris macdunnoughi]
MDGQFQLLFDKVKNEMQKQTTELQTSITNKIMERMDEKLQPIIAENKILKTKLENVEKDLETLKRAKKQNNLIVFGIKEDENSNLELLQKVKKVLKTDLSINIEDHDVNNIYRIGKAGKSNTSNGKRRRETSTSPENNNQPRKQQTFILSNANRLNAFDLMRTRSNSLPSNSLDNKQ